MICKSGAAGRAVGAGILHSRRALLVARLETNLARARGGAGVGRRLGRRHLCRNIARLPNLVKARHPFALTPAAAEQDRNEHGNREDRAAPED